MSSSVATTPTLSLLVMHAHWSDGALHLWAESDADAARSTSVEARPGEPAPDAAPAPHPFAADLATLRESLGAALGAALAGEGSLTLALPARNGSPLPSPHLAHAMGHVEVEAEGDAPANAPRLARFRVPTLTIKTVDIPQVLDALEDADAASTESDAAQRPRCRDRLRRIPPLPRRGLAPGAPPARPASRGTDGAAGSVRLRRRHLAALARR